MVFSSIVFLCIFFPIVFAGYFICPKKFRNLLLMLASLVFYAYGEPIYIFIMLFSTVFDYCNGRAITYYKAKEKMSAAKAVLVLSMVGNLGILGFFKYTDFAIGTINAITDAGISTLGLALPIGISFYTFQTMSYTIDVYRGKANAQKNFIDFAMYVCLFPQLIAGPIVTYTQVEKDVHRRKESIELVEKGLVRFSIGLAKKVLFANQIGAVYAKVSGLTGDDRTMAIAWLGAIAYTFQIYFDFSGYSDMAIGLGTIFGFHFPENFNYPYQSKSITEFWRRWHMTLGGWFREYVYIPLGGNRCGFLKQTVNMLIVWALTGLWHGANWNFVIWGLYYFIFLFLEKCIWKALSKKRALDKTPSISHIYTLFVVIVGWVIFSCESMSDLGSYLQSMVCIGVAAGNKLAMYEWLNYGPLLIVLCVAATSIPKKLVEKFLPEKAKMLVTPVFSFGLLFLCMAYLISGSYNPFLYFRF
ncbi:MAG: MBOAT family protein [Lachnospiraceae bacterium]|nr:MBOAT family protein [Lachnospiraceae bacterium]